MREQNQQQALEAFENGDFKTAAHIWINGYCLPEKKQLLKSIFQKIQDQLALGKEDEHLYSILGFMFLDYSHYFCDDREDALMQVISWSKKGLEIDAKNYLCFRQLGSALYWLNDVRNAKDYYLKAINLQPSPTLQIRVFNIENEENSEPSCKQIRLSWDGTIAMEYYNAGVELNRFSQNFDKISQEDLAYINQLKLQCYLRAYELYEATLIKQIGNPLNADGHTFAMCCNNLAVEYISLKEYEKSVDYCTTAMNFSYFLYLLQNRLVAYNNLKELREAHDDAIQIIDDFHDQLSLDLYFLCTISISNYLEIKNPREVLERVNSALEIYNDMNYEAPEKMDSEVITKYGKLLILKSNAQMKLGMIESEKMNEETIDVALNNSPTDPLFLINKALLLNNNGDYEKELECYDIAIKLALEQNNEGLLKSAFNNKGHTLIVQYKDYQQALPLFQNIIDLGLGDFWTYYWCAHCTYSLENNRECIEYVDATFASLPNQPNVTNDIIAQLYQYKGFSKMDLNLFKDAIESFELSLQYEENDCVRKNIKISKDNINSSSNLIKKLFKGW